MSYPQIAFFEALDARLSTGLSVPVRDGYSETLPYVGYSSETDREWGNMSVDGSELTVTLDIWALSTRETKEIMGQIDAALKSAPLSFGGGTQIGLPVREFTEVLRDYDETLGAEVRHGVVRYRFTLRTL